jgi:hypothetical protein
MDHERKAWHGYQDNKEEVDRVRERNSYEFWLERHAVL